MPSGKTHDAITILLAAPTFGAAWGLTGSLGLATVATAAMLFGGLMFGPDLDIQSKQYTRWGVFRFIWFPYKVLFRHRSRWSHGLLFGTLIRVLYFTGVIALLAAAAVYIRAMLVTGAAPGFEEVASVWRMMDGVLRQSVGNHVLWVTFCGLWWGAATHTLTDVGWSMLRKGSEIF
ncbi:MAG TPA: metal-binding protein [Pyrinomonadaceae bacterium]|nr:metal-binding protein [Pyrinomonadaceae bacterium]